MHHRFFYPLFIFLFFSISAPVFADFVEEIKIINLSRVDKSIVLKEFQQFERKSIEEVLKKIPGTLRRLYRTGRFNDINVSFEQNVLIVELDERPVVASIEINSLFQGSVKKAEVENIISEYFSVGGQFDDARVESMKDYILSLYQSKGYYETNVEIKSEALSLNRIKLTLDIQEGFLARVEKMIINGAQQFSVNQIQSLFVFEESTIISGLTDSDVFSTQKLEASLENIKAFYLERGYLDFEVLSYDWVRSLGSSDFVIYLHINEGKKYQVGSVHLLNALKRNDSYFFPLIDLRSGDQYQHSKLGKMIKKIQNVYQSFGYSYGEVAYEINKNQESGVVDIFLSVNSSVVSYVYRINFIGNSKTYDFVLRRELEFSEGQIFSKQALDSSIKNITQLGFFDRVTYEISTQEGHPSLVNIKILIQEKESTGQWSLGGSYSNANGWLYTAKFQQSNFLGLGDDLKLEALRSAGDNAVGQFLLEYRKRHFGDMPNTDLVVGGSYESAKNTGYTINGYDFHFRYVQPADEANKNAYLIGGLGAEFPDFVCEAKFAAEEPQCAKKKFALYEIQLGYLQNHIKKTDFPTGGQFFSTHIKMGLGDFTYPKVEISLKHYEPLQDNLTLKAEALAKAILAKRKDVPFFNRYFLATANSIRGFDITKFGERYSSVGVSKGGNLITTFKLEAVYNPHEIGINGVRIGVFADGGYIFANPEDFNIDDIRISSGASLHWLSPFGPVSLFKAWPIIKKDGDEFNENFGFSFGQSF